MSLKVNYQDEKYDGDKKYTIVENGDGTVSFVDVTEYTQEGSKYGAEEINELNTQVNKSTKDISDEITRATTTEDTLSDMISAEVERATDAEDALVAKNFVQLVKILNSSNITVTGGEKTEDGIQQFSLEVTGQTPSELTSNLTFFNNNPQQMIASNILIELDSKTNTIILYNNCYVNGEMTSKTSSIGLSSDEFKIVNSKLTLAKTYLTTSDASNTYLTKNDAILNYASKTELLNEATNRTKGDSNLQTQIDAINSRSDVVDVVATKADLDAYDKDISINDIVKVLQDETQNDATSYYRNSAESKPYIWDLVGVVGQYYTKSEVNSLLEIETNARVTQYNSLNTAITNEINRATNKETELSSSISNEKTRAEAEEAKKVNITDIKDDLTSSDTNKPLSANQGKKLKELLDTGKFIINTNTDFEFYKTAGDRKRLMLRPTGPKDITQYYTDGSLWTRITNGFDDIYVGDYFKMSAAVSAYEQTQTYQTTGSQYVTIADFNLPYNKGDSSIANFNTICCIPGQGLGGSYHFGRSRMNSSNTTNGGYVGSEMNSTTIGAVVTESTTPAATDSINQQLYNIFGSHLVTSRELLCNAVTDGAPSGWAWTNCQAVLMSEEEVYGTKVFGSGGQNVGTAWQQLALFQLYPRMLNNRSAWYWLKNVVSTTTFARVNSYGDASYSLASHANYYVRPRFNLKA